MTKATALMCYAQKSAGSVIESILYPSKPIRVNHNLVHQLCLHTKSEFLQRLHQQIAIDEGCTVAGRLGSGVPCERASSDDDAFVCSADHRTTEVTNRRRAYCISLAFALEQNRKTDQSVDADDSMSINTTITGSFRDIDFDKTRFSQDSLTKSLEHIGSIASRTPRSFVLQLSPSPSSTSSTGASIETVLLSLESSFGFLQRYSS